MPTQEITYDTDLEVLLKDNAEECESLSLLHRMSYEKYNTLSNIINVPVIVLSSAIGFATGIEIGYDKMNIILGVASIFVGIIKSVDSYFGLPKRAEAHRICSLQYAQLNKRIAVELSLKREQRQNPKHMLGLIKTDMKNLADIAPLIDNDIIKQFKDKYCDSEGHFATHTANITNGLTPIVINTKRTYGSPLTSPLKKEGLEGNVVPFSSHASHINAILFPETSSDDVVDVPEEQLTPRGNGGDGAMC